MFTVPGVIVAGIGLGVGGASGTNASSGDVRGWSDGEGVVEVADFVECQRNQSWRGFGAGGDCHGGEEGTCEQHEGCPAVPGRPGAALVFVQTVPPRHQPRSPSPAGVPVATEMRLALRPGGFLRASAARLLMLSMFGGMGVAEPVRSGVDGLE